MKSRTTADIITAQQIDISDFLVIDVETTGLSVEAGDRVCEIAAVKLRGGAVVETFSSLIDPQRPISAGAYAVNGISPQMLLNAPIFSAIADKFLRMIQDSIIVAYNAPFDMSFIQNEFRLIGYPAINNIVVDALVIARQILPGLGKYPQENVARFVGIPFPIKHRALEDAMATAQLFTIFTSILKAHDCTEVSDLQRRDLTHVLHNKRKTIVDTALTSRQNLWIKYLSPTNAEITDSIVTPREFFNDEYGKNRTTYLIAYCHTAKAERNFRLDRILDLRVV